MTTVLEVRGLRAGYGRTTVVEDLDLSVESGEVVALLGPNGAGKTTTLLTLSGLLPALAGTVSLGGVDVSGMRAHRRARAGLAHVPEDRSLFPGLTVAEHLRVATRGRRLGRAADQTVPTRDEVLGWFPPLGRLWQQRVGLLSGGEQQMVAVARALMARPAVLMVDELSLGLAPLVVRSLLGTMQTIAADTGCAVVLVEQHVQMALRHADRGLILNHGRLVAQGPAAELVADPQALRRHYLG